MDNKIIRLYLAMMINALGSKKGSAENEYFGQVESIYFNNIL